MASAMLPQVKDVDIDPSGVFKYILVKVTVPEEEKMIVRGYAECAYHADIFDKVREEIQKLESFKGNRSWDMLPEGGGRINHDAEAKSIKVYGYSQGYGRADHQVAVDLLKKKYSDYKISFSNSGY